LEALSDEALKVAATFSNRNPLDLIEGNLILSPVVELGRPWALV
jgi:hypothetical protein